MVRRSDGHPIPILILTRGDQMRYRLLCGLVIGLLVMLSSACGLRNEGSQSRQPAQSSHSPSYVAPEWADVERICGQLDAKEDVSRLVLQGYELRLWNGGKSSEGVECRLAGRPAASTLKDLRLEIVITEIGAGAAVDDALAVKRKELRDKGFKERGNCAVRADCWLKGTDGTLPASAVALSVPYRIEVTHGRSRLPGESFSEFQFQMDEGAVLVLRETLYLLG